MSGQHTPRTVLVIEDNDDCRATLRLFLRGAGFAVDTAADGREGVAKALMSRPDVVISDIGLPGLDGYEVARRVRAALGPAVLLIALTGYKSDEVHQQATLAGFDLFLIKPIDPELLRSCLPGSRSASFGPGQQTVAQQSLAGRQPDACQ